MNFAWQECSRTNHNLRTTYLVSIICLSIRLGVDPWLKMINWYLIEHLSRTAVVQHLKDLAVEYYPPKWGRRHFQRGFEGCDTWKDQLVYVFCTTPGQSALVGPVIVQKFCYIEYALYGLLTYPYCLSSWAIENLKLTTSFIWGYRRNKFSTILVDVWL